MHSRELPSPPPSFHSFVFVSGKFAKIREIPRTTMRLVNRESYIESLVSRTDEQIKSASGLPWNRKVTSFVSRFPIYGFNLNPIENGEFVTVRWPSTHFPRCIRVTWLFPYIVSSSGLAERLTPATMNSYPLKRKRRDATWFSLRDETLSATSLKSYRASVSY